MVPSKEKDKKPHLNEIVVKNKSVSYIEITKRISINNKGKW